MEVNNRFGCRLSILSITGRGTGEASAIQPFGQQTLSIAGGPQQFHLAAATSPEDENMAGRRIVFQRRLYLLW
ncbi:hypothetical protein ACWKXN_22360, partial [Enterobacter sp. UPMP2060]